MENKKITLGVCGTTERTVACVSALFQWPEFEIAWVITPPPKPFGRKKILTPSPLETWAREHQVPVKYVQKKLSEIKEDLLASQEKQPIDILFVVDFGYLIPPWLLELPTVAPLNVHPSDLPRWRGSSPGQFCLLAGDDTSAVCIMHLEWELDAGPVIARLPFEVPPSMTQTEYYRTAFALATQQLPSIVATYARATPAERAEMEDVQPADSPTPIASRLTRDDGFVPEAFLEAAKTGSEAETAALSATVQSVLAEPKLLPAQVVDRMVRALSPWPGVWTVVASYKGRSDVRLKILAGSLSPDQRQYVVTKWQYEGEEIRTRDEA